MVTWDKSCKHLLISNTVQLSAPEMRKNKPGKIWLEFCLNASPNLFPHTLLSRKRCCACCCRHFIQFTIEKYKKTMGGIQPSTIWENRKTSIPMSAVCMSSRAKERRRESQLPERGFTLGQTLETSWWCNASQISDIQIFERVDSEIIT